MPLEDLMVAIQSTPVGTMIRENLVLFPMIECVHVLALTFVVGTIALVDFRLLGVSARNHSVSALSTEILPFTWTAFVLAAITGGLLFVSNAVKYYPNEAFRIKLVLLVCAAVNMLIFHFITYKSVKEWDVGAPTPTAAKVAGALSLTFWCLVIIFGRRIGFTL